MLRKAFSALGVGKPSERDDIPDLDAETKAALEQSGIPLCGACDACPSAESEGLSLDDSVPEAAADPGFLRAWQAQDFDRKSKLLGATTPYLRHVVISSGKADWPKDIASVQGSVAQMLQTSMEQYDQNRQQQNPQKQEKQEKKEKQGAGAASSSSRAAAVPGVWESPAGTTLTTTTTTTTSTQAEEAPTRLTVQNGSFVSSSDHGEETVLVLPDFVALSPLPTHEASWLSPSSEDKKGTTHKAAQEAIHTIQSSLLAPSQPAHRAGVQLTSQGVLRGSEPVERASSAAEVSTSSSDKAGKEAEGEQGEQGEQGKQGGGAFVQRWVVPYSAIVFVCSHRRRDARCHLSAGPLKHAFHQAAVASGWEVDERGDELHPPTGPAGWGYIDPATNRAEQWAQELKWRKEASLRPGHAGPASASTANGGGGGSAMPPVLGLFSLSHIGGHKFAGNVIIYFPSGAGVWYGRVDPASPRDDVARVWRETVLGGKILTPFLRAGVNLRRGPEARGCARTPILDW